MNIVILLFALAMWGVIHSVLASSFAKDMLGGSSFYRLGYNIFAVLSFAPILYLTTVLPDRPLYQVSAPWSTLMRGGQALALLMLIIAFLQTDSLSFVGLRQLFEAENSGQLVTRGLYKAVRHPLYTFSLLFIWLSPTVSLNLLTFYVGVTFYTLVGAYFEERKLLREFGHAYAEYSRVTPMLIPRFVIGRK